MSVSRLVVKCQGTAAMNAVPFTLPEPPEKGNINPGNSSKHSDPDDDDDDAIAKITINSHEVNLSFFDTLCGEPSLMRVITFYK